MTIGSYLVSGENAVGLGAEPADFVPHDEIDPIVFQRTYYLGRADGVGASDPVESDRLARGVLAVL